MDIKIILKFLCILFIQATSFSIQLSLIADHTGVIARLNSVEIKENILL